MCDTIPINHKDKLYKYEPFGYDFKDVFGHKTQESLFVSKLLKTRKGNCHSLPYLYKILAEELGVDAHLALAPNHVYIKHKNIKVLQSGTSPVALLVEQFGVKKVKIPDFAKQMLANAQHTNP